MAAVTTTRPVRPGTLLTELGAALPALLPLVDPVTKFQRAHVQQFLAEVPVRSVVDVPDGTDLAVVNTVITNHNAATPSATEQQTNDDQTDLAAFPTRAQIANALTLIDADLVTLAAIPTLAQAGPILRRTVQNQRAIIRALSVLVRRNV